MFEFLALIAGALAVILIYMSLTWLLSRAINNSGIVDVAWASGFSILSIYYLLATQHINNLPKWVLAGMVSIWSLRLSWHLTSRFLHWFPEEDARYADLKKKLGKNVNTKMYFIFLWQGAVLCFLTAPLAVAALSSHKELGLIQFLATALWLIALIGESLADAQLTTFVKNPANKGRTCQIGLWSLSRHPNYFFEWLGAVAFSLFVCDMPLGIFTIACPLVLLHLLLNVTGVKPSEEHSALTRSDYAEYVKTTSPFFPCWRKCT